MNTNQQILSELCQAAEREESWRELQQVLADPSRGIHLAVMAGRFLDMILDGSKTIESRLSVNRIAPYERVVPRDLVMLKRSGGPVVGSFQAEDVEYVELNPTELARLERDYSEPVGVDAAFWQERRERHYASLIGVAAVKTLQPVSITKRGRSGWIVLRDSTNRQMTLL